MAAVPASWTCPRKRKTDIPTLRVKVDAAAAARYGSRAGRRRRGTADGSRRAGRGPGAGGPDRLSAGRAVRSWTSIADLSAVGETRIQTPGRRPDSAVRGRVDGPRGPRPELHHARERAAQDRRAVQRRWPRSCGASSTTFRTRVTSRSRCRRATTSSTAVSSRARPRRRVSSSGSRRRHRRDLLHPLDGIRLVARRAARSCSTCRSR